MNIKIFVNKGRFPLEEVAPKNGTASSSSGNRPQVFPMSNFFIFGEVYEE